MNKSIEDIWLEELNELRKELDLFYKEKEEIKNENKKLNKRSKTKK